MDRAYCVKGEESKREFEKKEQEQKRKGDRERDSERNSYNEHLSPGSENLRINCFIKQYDSGDDLIVVTSGMARVWQCVAHDKKQ